MHKRAGVASTKHTVLTASHQGRLFALGSAVSFAVIPVFGRLAYDAGASPGMVILARLLFGALAAGLVVWWLRRGWQVPRRQWLALVVAASAWMVVTVGYMASFYFIPVSLAVLMFFTFPVLIALVGPLLSRQRPELPILAAALVAFVGLVLALGPDVTGLDWRGCLLALSASVGATIVFLLGQRLLAEQDLFTFSLHLHVICLVLLAVGFALLGPPQLPTVAVGWLSLVGVSLFYASAMLQQFGAIRLAGPARASVVFNAEPVLTMLGAALILGDLLAGWQFVGAGLVIAGVLLSAHFDR